MKKLYSKDRFKNGGLKNLDIPSKIIAIQCPWIRNLNDNCFHECKLNLLKNQLKNQLALHLNFIQVYSLEVVKPSVSHLSIGKLF